MLRGLILVIAVLARDRLPGELNSPLGLAICGQCQWADLLITLDAKSCCESHGVHACRRAEDGESVTVACLDWSCDTPLTVVAGAALTGADLRCPAHRPVP